ncbi:bifunctional phosphopantothenoylcysteine decarboxylase/phosphopantothenate synthase [Adlercreutzia rubneri]|jgi:phosphopantothenoylcysteine decarboxylase/phosphopantothenate--cysteine ligase|uniref:Coenzyme A biosynthesis bifunctional protein CoaBC n=1 Tax=Adlercreutzia rubneri TaxID=2916441 RepID=A0A7K1T5A5_9ACTN|nr:bifunctional phosphopantothenoylcysteine decarboxylase/phosphopantothenate synthase [Adlercreutzia rubneri]MDR3996128.1 bifunctional phosphopantothenoylcysteine decarboxylase/phosphopantothenate synthase [Adlercreutzia sp.]MVN58590.1 phosphopantothenoylcysteine decarboxylase [Adlercreutzia rubneri]
MSVERPCILVGVTGCIAAYKAGEIVRGLQKAGVRVKVVMTEHGTHFVDPVTFRALTHEKVAVGLFDDPSDPIRHISLAQECDVFLIAPCTANVMAKVACGIADDLLSTTALATTATLAIAPAANVHMYEAAATQENMATLRRRGVRFIEGDAGYLACGDVGRGRLADPAVIVRETLGLLAERVGLDALREACEQHGEVPFAAVMEQISAVSSRHPERCAESASAPIPTDAPQPAAVADGAATMPAGALAGRTVLVTAGPTVEPIDSVRYISNYSSGKMGYAIAEAAAAAGARVVLVSGPVALAAPAGVEVVPVKTARDMLAAAASVFPAADAAIFAAAVADLRPTNPADRKLKKGRDDAALANVPLTENPDILATLAAGKRPDQYVVGFAAETNDVLMNAHAKLKKKNADMIVANQVGDGLAFGTDNNEVWLVTEGDDVLLPLMSKRAVAERLMEVVAAHLD